MVVNLSGITIAQAPAAEAGPRPSLSATGHTSPPSGNAPPQTVPIDTAKSIQNLTEFLSDNARGLRFSVDNASGQTIVTVVNPSNGEVIRQIPSEAMLHITNMLRRYGNLHLVDDEA